MLLFQDFLDQSKQLNQAQKHVELNYHPPKDKYKIVHQKLIIADLPAPLRYLNFCSFIGQANNPVFRNQSAIQTSALDTATVLASTSPNMLGQLSSYSIAQDCLFDIDQEGIADFKFAHKEQVQGQRPTFKILREDDELSFNLNIQTNNLTSHLLNLKFGFVEHWSLVAQCEGEIKYKEQVFNIQHSGAFEYARLVNFPYVSYSFYTYQLIQLNPELQIIFSQSRDQLNHILQSRIYIRDSKTQSMKMLDRQVELNIHRVFPKITTINQQDMYLPREFEWLYQDDEIKINLQAQSRGDYKFGLGAGYVGSFAYQVQLNEDHYEGEGGYCEYIDNRPLKWQEIDKNLKMPSNSGNAVYILLKK